MRNACHLPLLLLLSACSASRPGPASLTGVAEDSQSEYYVASQQTQSGMSRLGQKRLLPDPHGGLGTASDRTLRVTDIRLTDQYTVIYLTYGEDSQSPTYQAGSSYISIDGQARLVTGNPPDALKTFAFVKAEGIVLTPASQKVPEGGQVHFKLYFERLDRGIEDFSLFECADTPTTTCWNVRGMHVANPADSTAAPNRR